MHYFKRHIRPTTAALIAGIFALAIPATLRAQNDASQSLGYQTPPAEMVAIVDAQPTPVVRLDPKREWMVLAMRPSLPSIAELAEPELRLAGLRINPRNNGPSRSRGFTSRSSCGLESIS